MTISTKVQPFDRNLIVRLTGTAATRSAMLAEFAREQLAEAEQVNQQALGHVPEHDTYVDGRLGASEDSVKPDGVILYEFQLVTDALAWIAEQLLANSPVGSRGDPHPGLYEHSHRLFADGVEVDPADEVSGSAGEYVFIDNLPYSRKIEAGESRQAPDGVYEGVAVMAQQRFGKSLTVRFTYRAPEDGLIQSSPNGQRRQHRRRGSHGSDQRQPAIVVTVK